KSYFSLHYGMQYAQFGNTTYGWAQMPPQLSQPAPEVARLIYHCGVSVEMNYNLLGSGALTTTALTALKTYFGYSNAMNEQAAASYSPSAWANLLKSELDAARPLIYRSEQSGGGQGHAWVVDGYDLNGLFHCNWGWGGYYNGYFSLSLLNPNLSLFNQNHGAIIGIQPASPSLAARFTTDHQLVSAGDTLAFTDLSTGQPLAWSWSFPGALPAASGTQHPQQVVYPNPGRYEVGLAVSNGTITDTLTRPDYITVTPIADFAADRLVIQAGDSIHFSDLSLALNPLTAWSWSFPGGTPPTSVLASPPAVTYPNPGTFKVVLTVSSGTASHTVEYTQYIRVYASCDTLFLHNGSSWSTDPSISTGFSWLPQDLDGLNPYFAGAPYYHSSGWIVFNDGNQSLSDTNYFLGATSFFSPPGKADNWLSFGPFPTGPEGLELSWDHYYWFNDKRDGYEVLVSATGAGYQHFSGLPLKVFGDNDPSTDGDTLWRSHSLFLPDSLSGPQGVWVAFHHFANNQFYLFLDDISVTACSGLITRVPLPPNQGLWRVWPNPARGYLIIERPEDTESRDTWIGLYTADGRKVRTAHLSRGVPRHRLELGSLAPGLYLLQAGEGLEGFRTRILISP
ncbi:MAG TPA: C10 family peptidase, partial [Bacteroidales bacterium]|nr:C10 family peptidase [Bacteroidales bacterium]